MRPLSSLELLEVWEAGRAQTPAVRALSLLATAAPGGRFDELARLPVGERDGLLFALRQWHFGSRIESRADCPSCGEQLELDFEIADVLSAAQPVGGGALRLEADGVEVEFRLPTTADLLDGFDGNPSTWPGQLLQRCIVSMRRDGAPADDDALPSGLTEAALARLAGADPRSDIQLAVACEACGSSCELTFDIVTFLWAEIDAWAQRLLLDVHLLAAAYGWSENDILNLGPVRREFYLAASSR